MSKNIYLRQPGDSGWHMDDKVKIRPTGGMSNFYNKTGYVIGAEGEYLRIEFDEPINIPGCGLVKDDLFMPYLLKKLKSKY